MVECPEDRDNDINIEVKLCEARFQEIAMGESVHEWESLAALGYLDKTLLLSFVSWCREEQLNGILQI